MIDKSYVGAIHELLLHKQHDGLKINRNMIDKVYQAV